MIKPKQAGASWAASLWHLWLSYRPVSRVLCLSRGRDEAAELLDKTRFINENLPTWLRLKVSHDGREYMTFKDTRSSILALSSTKDAGVGYTASHVTRDEVEFHEFAGENYGHIKPTVDAGASILDMSTSNRAYPQSHLKMLYTRAERGENNYKAIFWPFWVRPGRTAEWYKRTIRDYWPRWLFEQDYPRTIQDALGSIEGAGLFDRASIDRLVQRAREPVEIMAGDIHIFSRPNPKLRYYAGGDASEGRGGNNGVIWIETQEGSQRYLCAIMCTNQLTPDLFANHAYQLLNYYNRPLLVMGADAWGKMVIDYLVALGYRDHIYCNDDRERSGREQTVGYIETEDNKQQKLMSFALAIRNGLDIPFRQAINELTGWHLIIGRNGKSRYEATYPTDDCVIAGANADIARELTPSDEFVTVDRFIG